MERVIAGYGRAFAGGATIGGRTGAGNADLPSICGRRTKAGPASAAPARFSPFPAIGQAARTFARKRSTSLLRCAD
ncbi:hypothetical protein MPPM_2391 [Methylorubrum populi]|uniref:Uncharacterized protein n=1 Tax=Methylorubrum populi TaxID=223967 RepID=A0A160PEK9_9HYPH|nr:hypothetical protein MPPM_2391 [Methylorubrum populi]